MLGVCDQVHTKEITPTALSESAIDELMNALDAGVGIDLIRDLVRWLVQELIEAGAAAAIWCRPL